MKKLTIGFVALVVTAVCSTLILSAKDRKTTIYMTKNYNPTGTIKSECIGVVVTDPLPAVKTDKITWQVKLRANADREFLLQETYLEPQAKRLAETLNAKLSS